jgi:cell division protein FtsW (lipid II flippase)
VNPGSWWAFSWVFPDKWQVHPLQQTDFIFTVAGGEILVFSVQPAALIFFGLFCYERF